MNAPNFAQLADDLRNQRLDQAERDKRRKAWLDRPLNEREVVIQGELMRAIGGADAEFKFGYAVAALHDHYADEAGMLEFGELLKAIECEDSGRAYELMQKAFGTVAKVEHENEGTVLAWDDLTYTDWDSRR